MLYHSPQSTTYCVYAMCCKLRELLLLDYASHFMHACMHRKALIVLLLSVLVYSSLVGPVPSPCQRDTGLRPTEYTYAHQLNTGLWELQAV